MSLAGVMHILSVLGPNFISQRERIERLWKNHFMSETVPEGNVIRKAYAETKGGDIRDINAERQVLKMLKGSPEHVKNRLYSRSIRGNL